MTDDPDLAALLGSRICRDLISPIGAIGNGVELLTMEGNIRGPEMALISESVAHANARIRFFRIAFGVATPDQRLGRPEVTTILADVTRGSRLTIDWQGPPDLPRRDVKLAFLLIQCLESAMVYGGRITVARPESRWMVTGVATKLRIEAPLWNMLVSGAEAPDLPAARVHFALAPREARRQSRRLVPELHETEIRVSF